MIIGLLGPILSLFARKDGHAFWMTPLLLASSRMSGMHCPGGFPLLGWTSLSLCPTISTSLFGCTPKEQRYVGATLAVAPLAGAPPAGGPRAVGAGASPAPTGGVPDTGARWYIPEPKKVNLNPALGDVVGAFQSLVFRAYLEWIRANDPSRQAKFWQRNYYEHIIRNERELEAIRQYIRLNPYNWDRDRDNLANIRRMTPPADGEEYVREALMMQR